MKLKRLNIVNFKNHELREFIFNKKISCFTGKNGVGKTNVLDAMYYLSFSKSFINPTDNQNIRNQEDFFTLRGVYEIDQMEENIVLTFSKTNGKTLKRNDKEYEKISTHIGLIPLVIINPQDIKLIFDGSAERRKFIDAAISQYNKSYLSAIQNYNRALLQRNKILKTSAQHQGFDYSLMQMWDMHLVSNAKIIHKVRKEFCEKFIPEFIKFYNIISGENEEPQLKYQTQLDKDDMQNLLIANFERDKILQHTSCGVHKDDLIFEISNRPLKNSGSQGQQKTFLAALKLAQFFHLRQNGKTPLLLLDDVFDKLDAIRVKKIVNLVTENKDFGQIFMSHTNQDDIKKIFENNNDYEIFEL